MSKFFQKKYSEKGFSLLEMLVVLFVISLLTVMILANYQDNRKKYTLLQSSQKLVSDLRKVQNMAISGTEITDLCSVSSICFGYGIYFNSNSSYILFADKNNDQLYSVGEEFETVNLPSLIAIQSISPSPASVFFKPPEPITYVNQSSATGSSAEIILQIQGTATTKTVTINTAGLIDSN